MPESPVGMLVKTSLVDYPGEVASAVFLRGCNLRCPYCYNAALVTSAVEDGMVTLSEVITHLQKRKNVLTGFVVSGGEPLVTPAAAELISAAKANGYKIKLDTNGMLPDTLRHYLNTPALKPDFVALDVKTSPSHYALLGSNANDAEERLRRSIALVSALPPDCREFRTVLVPPLVAEDDIRTIAAMLPPDATWMFAPFRTGACLDRAYDGVVPYTDEQTASLVSMAATLLPGAALR